MRPIRTLSKGMAQTVQLLGTIVHKPRLLVLDEPFSGLDAINQQRLEGIIRQQVAEGATVLFSTHVIAHAERLCERITVIAKGGVRFDGTVAAARDRLPARVHLRTRQATGSWRAQLPADTIERDRNFAFALPREGIEPVLEALIAGGAGIETLSIERPSLHEAFVDLVGGPIEADEAGCGEQRAGGGMNRLLASAWVIARRDYVATVFSRIFLLFLIGPLFPLLLVGIFDALGNGEDGPPPRPLVALVTDAPATGALFSARARLAARLGDDALPDLAAQPSSDADGRVIAHGLLTRPGPDGRPYAAVLVGPLAHPGLFLSSHAPAGLSDDVGLLLDTARATVALGPHAPPPVALAHQQVSAPPAAPTPHDRVGLARGAQTLLFFLIVLLAGMSLSTFVEEKSNKVIEVLAAAVPVDAIFLGKLGGMLAISLTGVAVWSTTAAAAVFVFFPGLTVHLRRAGGGLAGLLAAGAGLFHRQLSVAGSGVPGPGLAGGLASRDSGAGDAGHDDAVAAVRLRLGRRGSPRRLDGQGGRDLSVELAARHDGARRRIAGAVAASAGDRLAIAVAGGGAAHGGGAVPFRRAEVRRSPPLVGWSRRAGLALVRVPQSEFSRDAAKAFGHWATRYH